jgi:hypothetical protein
MYLTSSIYTIICIILTLISKWLMNFSLTYTGKWDNYLAIAKFYLKTILFSDDWIRRKMYLKFRYITLSQDSKVIELQYWPKIQKQIYLIYNKRFLFFPIRHTLYHIFFNSHQCINNGICKIILYDKEIERPWTNSVPVILSSTIRMGYFTEAVIFFVKSQITIY